MARYANDKQNYQAKKETERHQKVIIEKRKEKD